MVSTWRLSESTEVCPAGPGPQQPLSLGLLPSLLQKEKIREKFVDALKTEFAGKGLRFSRGRSVCAAGRAAGPPPAPQG